MLQCSMGSIPMISLLVINIIMFLYGLFRFISIMHYGGSLASGNLLLNAIAMLATVALSCYLVSVWNKPVFRADLFRYAGVSIMIFILEACSIFLDEETEEEVEVVESGSASSMDLVPDENVTSETVVVIEKKSAVVEDPVVENVTTDVSVSSKESVPRTKPAPVIRKERAVAMPEKVLYIITHKEQFNVALFQSVARSCSCIPFQIGYVVPDAPANILQGVILDPNINEKREIVEEEIKTQFVNQMKVYTKALYLPEKAVSFLKQEKQVNITQLEPLCDKRSFKRLVKAYRVYDMDMEEVGRLLRDFKK